jgi:ABC-type nitrate/sulfonate/bicarbonate transport system substrate-binding protein
MARRQKPPQAGDRFSGGRRHRPGRAPTVRILAAACVVAVLAAGCSSAQSKQLTTITFGVPGDSSSWGFLYIAQKVGLFKQNGISANVETVSVPTIVPGIISGSFQATPLTGTVETAALKGQPLVDVMTVENRDDAGLAVDAGITSVSQLAGKTIVTASAGTAPYKTLVQLLKKHGLSTTQVKILPLATVPEQVDGFVSGEGQAIFLTYNNVIQATTEVSGSKIIVTPQEAGPVGGFSGVAVAKSYLQQHANVVSDIVKSILEAVKYLQTHRASTEKIFENVFGLTKSQASNLYTDADQIYQLNPVPTTTELANDATASSQAGTTFTESQIAALWDTSVASKAYKQLNCPAVC